VSQDQTEQRETAVTLVAWDQLEGKVLRGLRDLLDSEVTLVRLEKGVQTDYRDLMVHKGAKVQRVLKDHLVFQVKREIRERGAL